MTDDDDPEDELRRDHEGSHDPDEFDSGGVDFTSVFVLRARGPFQDWARQIVEEGPEWMLPDIDRCRAYLTPELPTQSDADRWLRQNYGEMFARELVVYVEDEAQWPPDRSFETFLAWFEVIFAPTLDDMSDSDVPAVRRPATCVPLSLRRVRAEFLRLPADGSLHVDIDSGELFAWTDDELDAIQAGDPTALELSPEDMHALQDAFAAESRVEIAHRADVENVDTMAAFVATIASPAIRNRLVNALEARKAERRFKEAIEIAGLRHRWSAWLEHLATRTLRDFMEARGVPFVDDVEEGTNGHPREG
jgi:hypothetical protein